MGAVIEGCLKPKSSQIQLSEIDKNPPQTKSNLVQLKQSYSQKSMAESQFSFQYIENEPNTLTMIRIPKNIINLMYELPVYVWIDSDIIQQEKMVIEKQMNNQKMIGCQNLNETKDILRKYTNIIVICSLRLAEQVEKELSANQKVKTIICYCMNILHYEKLKGAKKLGQKFRYRTDSQSELIEILKENRFKNFIKKQLPNFVFMKDDIWKSNTLIKTIHLMLNQQTNRSMLMKELIKLARWSSINQEHKIKQFQNKASNQSLSPKDAIQFYTQQSFLYGLINSLLRSSCHPCQIYYLQPYFKDLFNAIKDINKQQGKGKENVNFKCYRGGFISQNQIVYFNNSVGSVIQSLGFLSTSKRLQVAQAFCQNALFQISVSADDGNVEDEFGFADVSQYSPFPDEQQILFNPLATFKILSVKSVINTQKKYYKIELEYGIVSKLIKCIGELENNSQRNAAQLGLIQKLGCPRLKLMGDILILESANLEGSSEYWQKYLSLSSKGVELAHGYYMLGVSQQNKSNNAKALSLLESSLQILQQIQTKKEVYVVVLNQIAINQIKLGKYRQSLRTLQKCEQICREYSILDLSYLNILNNIGHAYDKLGQYDKALSYYTQSLSLHMSIFGQLTIASALTMNNIGTLCVTLKRYQDAIGVLQKVRNIRLNILGPEDRDYLVSSINLANCYFLIQNYPSAEQILLGVMATIKQPKFQIAPQIYYSVFGHLANVYIAVKKYQQAFQVYQQHLSCLQKNKNKNGRDYTIILANMGVLYHTVNINDKSLQFLLRSKQNFEMYTIKEEHIEYAFVLSHLGQVYMSVKKYNEAIKMYEESLKIRKAKNGQANQQYIKAKQILGLAYCTIEQYPKCVLILTECQQSIDSFYGELHVQSAMNLKDIGRVYIKMRQFNKASHFLERCLEIQQQVFGQNDKSCLQTKHLIYIANLHAAFSPNTR